MEVQSWLNSLLIGPLLLSFSFGSTKLTDRFRVSLAYLTVDGRLKQHLVLRKEALAVESMVNHVRLQKTTQPPSL